MTDDFDDLDPSTLCDRCGEETPVVDTSTGLEAWSEWVGATLCPDCWAEIDGEEAAVATQASVTTNGPEDDSRAAGDRLLASDERVAFLQDIDGIDADGIDLLLTILRTANRLQTSGETATFLQTILETLQAYADIETLAPIIAPAAPNHVAPV